MYETTFLQAAAKPGTNYGRERLAIKTISDRFKSKALKLITQPAWPPERYAQLYGYIFEVFAHSPMRVDVLAKMDTLDTGLVLYGQHDREPRFVNSLASQAVWTAILPRMKERFASSSKSFAAFSQLVRV